MFIVMLMYILWRRSADNINKWSPSGQDENVGTAVGVAPSHGHNAGGPAGAAQGSPAGGPQIDAASYGRGVPAGAPQGYPSGNALTQNAAASYGHGGPAGAHQGFPPGGPQSAASS